MLYVALERLALPEFRQLLQRFPPTLIAIDEAHCISQWGRFPSGLPITRQPAPRISGDTHHRSYGHCNRARTTDIIEQLRLRRVETFLQLQPRQFVVPCAAQKQAFPRLLQLVQKHKDASVIIYCFRARIPENTAADLRAEGIDALPYHAGLDATIRRQTQEKFIRDEVTVICATIAFGMGNR